MIRAFWVGQADALDPEDSDFELVTAHDSAEAIAVWRQLRELSPSDIPDFDLDVHPASWDWPGDEDIPEPPIPDHVGRYDVKGKAEGMELERGYGFIHDGDRECICCGHWLPRERWTIAAKEEEDEDGTDLCDSCTRRHRSPLCGA